MQTETRYEFSKYELEILKESLSFYSKQLKKIKEDFTLFSGHYNFRSNSFGEAVGETEHLLEKIDSALNR